jgi:hypothetical protein
MQIHYHCLLLVLSFWYDYSTVPKTLHEQQQEPCTRSSSPAPLTENLVLLVRELNF